MVLRPGPLTKDIQGAAVVEFAILTPVFLLLLTGMMAYGIYFGAAHSIQQLAADAARTAIAGINVNEGRQMVRDYLQRNAGAYMLIDPQRLSFDVLVAETNASQYRVELRYDATGLPIWNLYPPLPLPSREIVQRATIRRGGI